MFYQNFAPTGAWSRWNSRQIQFEPVVGLQTESVYVLVVFTVSEIRNPQFRYIVRIPPVQWSLNFKTINRDSLMPQNSQHE